MDLLIYEWMDEWNGWEVDRMMRSRLAIFEEHVTKWKICIYHLL